MRPAAAQIAVQSLPHLLLSRGGTVAQQADRGHHHAGGAVAALGGLLIDERLLDRMEPAAARHPLHGDDRAVHGRHRQVAGRAGATPDEHEARPAQPRPAAEPRPGQAQVMAEHVEQRRIRLAGHAALRAVHGQPEPGLHHDFLLWAGWCRGWPGQMAFSASVLVTTRPRAPYSCRSPNISRRMDWSRPPTPDRVEAGRPDQVRDQVAGRVVVGGVEQHRPVGLLPGGRGQRGGRQRAERLDQPRPGRQQPGQDLARGLLLADDLAVPALAVRPDRVARVDDHLAGQPRPVLGDELPEVVEPDGDHEHPGPLDRLVDAHHFGVAVQPGRDLPGGLAASRPASRKS